MSTTKSIELTQREAKAVELIKQGETMAEALRQSGYPASAVDSSTRQFLDKPAVQNALSAFQDELRKQVTDETLVRKLRDKLEAQKVDPTLKTFVDDHQAQLKAIEMILKVQRYIKDDKSDVAVQVNIENVLE